MENETTNETVSNRIPTWDELGYDEDLEMDFSDCEDTGIPRFSFCDI